MMDQLNSVSWLSQALPIYKTTLAMIGKEGGIETAFGKCYANKETESETAILEHNLVYFKIVCFNKMYVAFMFRRFSTMKELAEKFFSCSPRLFTFLIFDVMTTFYGGLVSFWIARKTTESDRDDIDSNVWFKHGEMALSMLKGWAVSSKVC